MYLFTKTCQSVPINKPTAPSSLKPTTRHSLRADSSSLPCSAPGRAGKAEQDLARFLHLGELHPFVDRVRAADVARSEYHRRNAGVGDERCIRAIRHDDDFVLPAYRV